MRMILLVLNWIFFLFGLLSVIAIAARGYSPVGLMAMIPFAAAIAALQLYPNRWMNILAFLANFIFVLFMGYFFMIAFTKGGPWAGSSPMLISFFAANFAVVASNSAILLYRAIPKREARI